MILFIFFWFLIVFFFSISANHTQSGAGKKKIKWAEKILAEVNKNKYFESVKTNKKNGGLSSEEKNERGKEENTSIPSNDNARFTFCNFFPFCQPVQKREKKKKKRKNEKKIPVACFVPCEI